MATYWKIHSNKRGEPFEDQLGDAMNEEEPPEGNLLLLLPPNIYGFNMQEKKWSMTASFHYILESSNIIPSGSSY